jgi:hypothetical protein
MHKESIAIIGKNVGKYTLCPSMALRETILLPRWCKDIPIPPKRDRASAAL